MRIAYINWRIVAVLLVAMLGACASSPSRQGVGDYPFKLAAKNSEVSLMSKEDLALLEESSNPVYLFGSGDRVSVNVFGRPEVSGKHVIGPDGIITLPLAGDVFLNGLTREDVQQVLEKRLRIYFTNPHVTLGVDEYNSNQVTVLGRVGNAGVQRFPHPPTLAEVLANAGALPILDKQATLTRCAIMRGREKFIWVDLKALLTGDLGYNIRMKKGDIVFIPDSSDTSIYVLGAVPKPGSYRLTPRMTVLDALAQAGGPNENAHPEKIGIYRSGTQQAEVISFSELIGPQRAVNFALEDGDVLFVPTSGLADFGYFLRQISPFISVLTFGLAVEASTK